MRKLDEKHREEDFLKKKKFSIRSVFVREYSLFFFMEKYDMVIIY